MKAPARPPAATPMRARSRTERVLRRGIRLGRAHLEVEAMGRVGVWEEKCVRREGKSVRFEIENGWGLGEGRLREDETLAERGEVF